MVGMGELLVIGLIAVLLFGAGRISEIGKGLGEGIKNFKKGLRDEQDGDAKQLGAKKKGQADKDQTREQSKERSKEQSKEQAKEQAAEEDV